MKRRLGLLLTSALWLYILAAVAVLSLRFNPQLDMSSAGRNTLTPASQQLLASMPNAISATAWVFPSADTRSEIQARFAPYLRAKDNFTLQFRDPASDPQAVRQLGISQSGEVVLDYQDRQENLSILSEPDITAALQRLSSAQQANIVFTYGHAERDLRDDGQSGYSKLAAILAQKGWQSRDISLASATLPQNTDLLVVAAPQQAMLAGEMQQIKQYLEQGGAMLWLTDPALPQPAGLARMLGLELLDGTLIYQDYELIGSGHPAMAIVAGYPKHPILQGMNEITAFAGAAALTADANSGWQATPLLTSVARSWLESGPMQDQLSYDQDSDIMGPVHFGYALQRDEQRAVAVADSDFLSNAYLTQVGNRPLAVAMFSWLLARDDQINVDVPPAPDASLSLSPLASKLIGSLFVLVLPLLFFATGLLRWWSRRSKN